MDGSISFLGDAHPSPPPLLRPSLVGHPCWLSALLALHAPPVLWVGSVEPGLPITSASLLSSQLLHLELQVPRLPFPHPPSLYENGEKEEFSPCSFWARDITLPSNSDGSGVLKGPPSNFQDEKQAALHTFPYALHFRDRRYSSLHVLPMWQLQRGPAGPRYSDGIQEAGLLCFASSLSIHI